MPFDPSVEETRDASTLRAFWYWYCPKHRELPEGQVRIVAETKEPTE
jgi:hypothetical protein